MGPQGLDCHDVQASQFQHLVKVPSKGGAENQPTGPQWELCQLAAANKSGHWDCPFPSEKLWERSWGRSERHCVSRKQTNNGHEQVSEDCFWWAALPISHSPKLTEKRKRIPSQVLGLIVPGTRSARSCQVPDRARYLSESKLLNKSILFSTFIRIFYLYICN